MSVPRSPAFPDRSPGTAESAEPIDWRQLAACRGSSEEFVDVSAEAGAELVERFCARCPTVAQCAELAREVLPTSVRSVWAGEVYEKGERPPEAAP